MRSESGVRVKGRCLYQCASQKNLEVTSNSARVFLRRSWYLVQKKMCSHFAQCSDLLLYIIYRIYRDKKPTGANIWRRHAPFAAIVIFLIAFELNLVVAASRSLSNDIHVSFLYMRYIYLQQSDSTLCVWTVLYNKSRQIQSIRDFQDQDFHGSSVHCDTHVATYDNSHDSMVHDEGKVSGTSFVMINLRP